MPLLIIQRLYRKLWLRVTFYALASLIAAAMGSFADLYFADRLSGLIKLGAVNARFNDSCVFDAGGFYVFIKRYGQCA